MQGRGSAVVATGLERAGRQLTYALLDIERRRQAEARMSEAQASLQRISQASPLHDLLVDQRDDHQASSLHHLHDDSGNPYPSRSLYDLPSGL